MKFNLTAFFKFMGMVALAIAIMGIIVQSIEVLEGRLGYDTAIIIVFGAVILIIAIIAGFLAGDEE